MSATSKPASRPAAPSGSGPTIITLSDRKGGAFTCEVLDVVDFEGRQYCLLLRMPDSSQDEGALVLMRLISEDDHSVFEELEAAEFERVKAHITALAARERMH